LDHILSWTGNVKNFQLSDHEIIGLDLTQF